MSKSTSIHSLYQVYEHQKTELLLHLLEQDAKLSTAMIFVLRSDDVHALTTILSKKGKHVDSIHGKKKPEARLETMTDHLSGKLDFLVVSEAIARNLDFSGVKNIINYDFPELPDDYITQSENCTAGSIYSFDNPKPSKQLMKLQEYIEGKIPSATAEGFNYAPHALKVTNRNKPRKRGPRSKPLQNKKSKLKRK